MNDRASVPPEPIRLLFQLERCDNPHLYDELIRFKKGSKRVNRLRTLAREGLFAQDWPQGFAVRVAQVERETAPRDSSEASITSQVFDEPLTE